MLTRQRLQHPVVIGVLVIELDDVVIDVLDGPLQLDPRLAELFELHQGHGAGCVLQQRLVDAQRDRRSRFERAINQMLLQNLVSQGAPHRRCGVVTPRCAGVNRRAVNLDSISGRLQASPGIAPAHV
jgi:hypothetical protein